MVTADPAGAVNEELECDRSEARPRHVVAFLGAFLGALSSQDIPVDLANPGDMFDISDVVTFLNVFGAGCP